MKYEITILKRYVRLIGEITSFSGTRYKWVGGGGRVLGGRIEKKKIINITESELLNGLCSAKDYDAT